MAIELITNTPKESTELFKINHAYHTNYAWQMNRKVNAAELMVDFKRVRLPRELLVQPSMAEEERIARNLLSDMVMVAIKEDQPVGYVALKKDETENLVTIIDLVVRQNHRRKGIGTMLLTGAQDWTSHLGYQRLIASIPTKNDPAIGLLTKAGFDYCGFQEFITSSHDIVLFYGTYLR